MVDYLDQKEAKSNKGFQVLPLIRSMALALEDINYMAECCYSRRNVKRAL